MMTKTSPRAAIAAALPLLPAHAEPGPSVADATAGLVVRTASGLAAELDDLVASYRDGMRRERTLAVCCAAAREKAAVTVKAGSGPAAVSLPGCR